MDNFIHLSLLFEKDFTIDPEVEALLLYNKLIIVDSFEQGSYKFSLTFNWMYVHHITTISKLFLYVFLIGRGVCCKTKVACQSRRERRLIQFSFFMYTI